jgi:membrane protein DedA with SNARE-associated domain
MAEQLIQDYGYLAVTLITLLEGESIVILAGIAVGAGQLTFGTVILCAVLGSVAGDQFWFHVGRRWGARLISRRPSWTALSERVFAQLQTRETFLMLTFRFYYGLRTVMPLAIGAARTSPLRFLGLNLIGAAGWATTFTLGGYLLGETLMRHFNSISGWGAAAILGTVFAAVVLVHLLSTRMLRRG